VALWETDFPELDELLEPTMADPKAFTILAGRPGMGKSTLMRGIVLAALNAGRSVYVHVLEGGAENFIEGLACWLAGVNRRDLSNPRRMAGGDLGRFTEALSWINECPLHVSDKPATVEQIRAESLRLQRKHGVGLVLVDYLQIITPSSKGSRYEAVTHISQGGRRMTNELGVPVIFLSQLSRALESRHDKRPVLSDLRESGAIEQDANAILFVYRDEYYYGAESEHPGEIDVIVAKQRDGETRTVTLGWAPSRARIIQKAGRFAA